MKMPSSKIIAAVSLALAANSLFTTAQAAATIGSWNSNTSGNWSDNTKWTGGIPTLAGDTANLNFNITTVRTVTIDTTPRTVGTLNIGDSNATSSYTLVATGGATLTFDNSGSGAVLTELATSNGDTISAPILLNDNLAINVNATAGNAGLNLQSTISSASGLKTITNSGTAPANNLKASGVISDGSGQVAVVQNSAGSALVLSGANTYTGGTTLTAGVLNLGNASALGTGALTITGGSLNSSVANLVNSQNNAQNWNGNFAFGGTNNLDLGTGAVTMSGNRTVTVNANNLTVGGVIGDGGSGFGLTKAGVGALTLTGANTYSGGTTLSNGTLNLGNASALGTGAFTISGGSLDSAVANLVLSTNNTQNWNGNFAFTGTNSLNLGTGAVTINATRTITTTNGGLGVLTVGGVIGESGGSFGLIKAQDGTLTLGGVNTFTGNLTIQNGTLNVSTVANSGVASNLGAGSTVQFGNGAATGILNYTGSGGSTNRTLQIGSIATTGGATINNNGTNGGTGLKLTGSLTSASTSAGTITLGGTNTDANTVSGVISNGTSSAISLVKAGAGTWTLTGANTYNGTTTINGGTLQLGDGTTGHDGTIANSASLVNNAALVYNRFGSNSYSGVISGTGTVTMTGPGSQTLTNANSYSGTTTISQGTLVGANDKALGNTIGVTISGGALDIRGTTAGTLTLGTGANLGMSSGSMKFQLGTVSDQVVSSGSGTFTLTGGSLTLDVTDPGFNYANTYNILAGFGGANTVSGLSYTGYDTANFTANLDTAGNLSFTAVPEPSTYAMIFGGAGALMLFRRRRA